MKTHFCIPVSQQRPDALGGRYVLYSVYLDGLLFCRVRYSQLHRWNQQLRRVFGSCLPPFPPKYYLAMTTSMAEERRAQLEQYLQNVTADPNALRSDVFIEFLQLAQLNTFNISAEKASLDIFLPNGRSVNIEILTSDTAERVLEVVSHKLGLSWELLGYFGLFLIRFYKEGSLSVVKKLADFELPYVSLRSSEEENCKVGLRKWYMDPALDSVLMGCRAAVELLYMQDDFSVKRGVHIPLLDPQDLELFLAHNVGLTHGCGICGYRRKMVSSFAPINEAMQDIEKEWIKPTQGQRQELEALQKENNQTKFLELCREVQCYGYMQLDPCRCDSPEPGCGAVLSVGKDEICCCVTLPDSRTQDVILQMSSVKCWQVTFLGTLLDMDGPQRTLNQNLELRFQYSEDNHWQWFIIYTKQAFLLSSCLKKMISEKMAKQAAENTEMQKKHSSFLSRKHKIKRAEGVCVFGTIKEEDL